MLAFVLCFLVVWSLSIASFAEATKSVGGFSVDLIHRDSLLSPFYNPSLTPSERIQNAALHSIARSKRLGLSQNEDGSPKTITIPDLGMSGYVMRFYIGTPPVERFAFADTGSDLIWVQCSPCKKCSPQNVPLFDPRKSSTFRSVSCDSQPCTLLPQTERGCTKSGECSYKYLYGDSSNTFGKLSVDSINFGSKGGGKSVKFPKITFGCGYNNTDAVPDETKRNTGLVGLGAGPLSLVSQLGDIGKKFSYCLLPMDSNTTSKLKFGDHATIKGKGVVSTPLIIKSSDTTFYYANLEGISIGKKKVKMSRSQTQGNIVIDSGSTITSFQQSFYNKFVTLLKEVIGGEVEKNPPDGYNFCLRVKDSDDNNPDIVFHFTGAKVHMNFFQNMFTVFDGNLICLSVQPTSEHGLNILGNVQQIGFQVEFDLKGGKVSFAPADCAKH